MKRLLLAILLLSLAVSSKAGMIMRGSGNAAPAGIAHGNDSSGQATSSTTSYTLSHNLSAASGNNRLLIVGVSLDLTTGPPTLSCTYSGTEMTAINNVYLNGMQVRLFYLLDAALPASAGAANIVCSTTNAGYLKIIASDFTGVDQAAPDDSSTATAASAYDISVAITTSVADSLVWAYSAGSSSAGTWDGHRATATVVAELEGGSAHVATATYEVITSTGDATFADSVDGLGQGNMVIVGASFAPAGS
jgi:hypothetical protein